MEPSLTKPRAKGWTSRLGRAQLGRTCALVTAVLCGLGSALDRFAPNFHHRHIGQFWFAPRWHTLWLLGLWSVVLVWLLHALVVALGSRRTRPHSSSQVSSAQVSSAQVSRAPAPVEDAAPKFTFALAQLLGVAMLVGYLSVVISKPAEIHLVTEAGATIHGEHYRALRIESPSAEGQLRRPTAAWLERSVGTTATPLRAESLRVERGKWWPSRDGNFRLALARAGRENRGAVFRHGDRQVTLETGAAIHQGSQVWRLRALFRRVTRGTGFRDREARNDALAAPHAEAESARPDAALRAELEIGGKTTEVALDPEWAGQQAFLGMRESPRLVLRVYRDLTTELACTSILLFVAAVLLVRLPRHRFTGHT